MSSFSGKLARIRIPPTALFILIVIGTTGAFVYLATSNKQDLLIPVVLGLLAGLTVTFAVALALALYAGDVLSLESRGSGFGGGLGGWRASAALGLLIAALFFGCLTAVATGAVVNKGYGMICPTEESTATPAATPASESTATPTATPTS